MTTAAQKWASDLASWAIPEEILAGAPESPWIHPVKMFTVTGEITESPSHLRAREALPSGGAVLDVGCGGGRASMALVPPAAMLTGVDEEQPMLDRFEAAALERGVAHAQILGRWPAVANVAPRADVVVCHHVLYNVSDLVPFIRALDDHAGKRVVIEIPTTHPLSHMGPLWKQFWDLDRPSGPTAHDAVEVIGSVGIEAQLEIWQDDEFSARALLSAQEQAHYARIRLCLPAEREAEVAAFLADAPPPPPRQTATIWWDKLPQDRL
jgi:SAM-dependent methyltransferase